MNIDRLNTNEISVIWEHYIQNSLYSQLLKYFKKTSENEKIKEIISECLHFTEKIAKESKAYFESEGLPVPHGFSEDDVNLNADKLFLDESLIIFIGHTLKAGVVSISGALMMCVRKDVRDFFSNALREVSDLFNKCIEIEVEQNIYIFPPQIELQQHVEYVESKKYFTQTKRRPLNTIELMHLWENIRTNAIGEVICMGFAQTTNDKEVKDFIKQGMRIAQKHINIFSEHLEDSHVHAPAGTNSYVTNSTEPVFSDRLIVNFLTILSAIGQANYATAASSSMRYDLTLNYQRLSVEIALYEKDGADLLVKNGWLEEPPQIPDRKKLIN
ncbi:DUF3231 family protein [Bacillaceae bacterium W0354]